MTNPFFKEIADAMTDEAGKSGYEVVAVSSEEDPAKQLSQVQDFIVQKVDAIVLTPANSRSVGTAIKEANQAGIPVFTADIASLSDEGEVECHIATDNYSGGREAAKAIMEALGNQGKVAIIDHPEVESVILRTKGFREELKEAGSPIEIVGAWPGKGSKDEAFKVAQDILTAHQDLDAIFAINDPSALGAVAAIEKAGKAGKVLVVGFDGQLEGKQAILEGRIYADPIQFPDQIGRQTVQTILKYLGGEEIEPEVLIPTELYRKADAEKDPALNPQ
jgi:ribose transport system substrate-binding protein